MLLVVLLGIGIFLFKPKKIDSEKYTTQTIDSIREIVSGSGSLNASGVTMVYSPTNGIVKSIFVSDGQKVKAGEKLFEITSSATDIEKATALSNLMAAKSALKTAENAKNTLQVSLESARKNIFDTINSKKIFDEYVLAQKPNPVTGRSYTDEEKQSMVSTLDSANKTFKNLEKQYLDADDAIRSANAAYSEASLSYLATKDSITKSPFEGKVFNLKKNVGDTVSTSSSKQPVLVIVNSDQMTIEFQVSEFNVNKLKIGQKVEIGFDALLDQQISGEVSALDTVGDESLGTVTYDVIIKLLPTENQLSLVRPAMTANITIVTNQKDKVITLPRSALKVNKGIYTVVKNTKGKDQEVEVTVGLIGADKVEITSGLNQSDNVLKIFSLPK